MAGGSRVVDVEDRIAGGAHRRLAHAVVASGGHRRVRHLAGAVHRDADDDLAAPLALIGGNHQMPCMSHRIDQREGDGHAALHLAVGAFSALVGPLPPAADGFGFGQSPFVGLAVGAHPLLRGVGRIVERLVEKRKLKRSISALLITAETIFVFLIPLGLTVWMVANKLQDINLDPQTYIAPIQQVAEFIKEKTGYDVLGKDTLSFIMSILPRIGQIIMESISSLAINLFVMIFVLYFMLIGGKKMEAYVNDILPFNETNTQEVIHEINMIVRSNAIGIPLLAIIQGGVAMIGYLLFGAPNILMLGFLTCFATIIPMVGTALVWFPVAAYLAISGDWFNAIGLFGYGAIVVSQSDNLIRFILQKKMADTHPLITIFGVVIGLPIFGFMGVIFGPLLLSLFFLFVDMFKKEYLDLRNNLPSR